MLFYILLFLTMTAISLCILYVVLIGCFSYGWSRTDNYSVLEKVNSKVTVIVAARNEEKNIADCLDALILQLYSADLFEICVVDDSSDDNTVSIVKGYIQKHAHIRLIELKGSGREGKKKAIGYAIATSDSELIVTTDADCTMGQDWLSTIVSFFKNSGAGMVVAPVAFNNEKNVFEKMQSLELMALMGSTGGALYFNKPILCNGANLAYKREFFLGAGGYSGIEEGLSGDDVLLMYKMNKKYPHSVHFLKSKDAIVRTGAKKDLREFIEQRKRWASKGFAVMNPETKAVALLVYCFNLVLVVLGLLSAFSSVKWGLGLEFFRICLILTGIKCFIDFLLLFLAASFFDKKHYLLFFLPEQFIYIFYVVVVGLLGNRGKYVWKGRRSV